MPFHPIQEAFGVGELPTGTGSAEDIADAVERYSPFVAMAVSDITTRSLANTKNIVLIIGASIRFYKYDPENTDAEDGETVILDSEDRAFTLVQRGDRYDIPFGSTGLMGDGEAVPAYPILTPLILPAGLPGSVIKAVDAVPASDCTITFKKSVDHGATWSTVFTGTILAGQREGTFTLAADAALAAGSLLRAYGPNPHDSTMQGLSIGIAAYR